MRPSTALSLLPAVALALAASADTAAAPQARQRPVVLAASPAHEPSDRPGGGYLRVTFSPDGDGRDDAVRIRVRTKPGERLRLRVAPVSRSGFYVPLPRARGKTTTVVWNGLRPDGTRYGTGSYAIRVCDATTRLCASTRVLAHLRLISLSAHTDAGVSVGGSVRVLLSTDRSAPTTLDLVPSDDLDGPGLGAVRLPPGWSRYRIPAVPHGGLWIMRARNGSAVTHYPLVVHEPSLRLADPPAHTALVVYPYLTWRAYDMWDGDRDGRVDSWYAHPRDPVVPLFGPFEPTTIDPDAEGLEANPQSQAAFIQWLRAHKLVAEHVTDVELGRIAPEVLQRYAEVVFEGHTEYYELGTYRKMLRYRNAGGRLYFLQGNSFYGQAQIVGDSVWRRSYRFRTKERSDFAIAVTGFRSCCWPESIRPRYHLAAGAVEALPWAFADTDLKAGDPFGVAAGEVDTIDPRLSPPGTVTIATATVPPFTPKKEKESEGWIGEKPIPYEPAWKHPEPIAIAYARVGLGEVFTWANTGFMKSIRYADVGVPVRERALLDRVALNVWEHFAR